MEKIGNTMSGDNILVAIKSRPLIPREKSEKLRPQWAIQNKTIFQIDEHEYRQGEPYSFDHIFTEQTTNATVYDAVVEQLVKSFLNGFNSTIFAYGQTSSGKTHTMMGTDRIPGIIQLAISDVFQHVSSNSHRRYLISCSYFEIYNEKINDLLDKNGQDLKIREDYCGNTFIHSKEELVTEAKQVYDLMKIGEKTRKIGCTNMNERSSRSHTIFRLTMESTENNVENAPVQISRLNLVDLAGSERIAHTKAAGVRLKEGVNINKSLLALGNVIRQLSEGEGYINYRDSNLTRLLQHSLGGNAKSLIIATITTAAGEETKSTLEFAQRAKIVKNKPVINELQSKQDKSKQYELVTASYKNRLEKEKQRIADMEHEKEEREREILRLKQQVKLIDLFTNGPEQQKSENRIPRRHTVGHYGSRIPLETIPESKIMTSNIIQESIDEEMTVKMLMDESLDEGILPITPEPPEELQDQVETTPVSHLRVRLKHLEESYTSLQEFTRLESQCREYEDPLPCGSEEKLQRKEEETFYILSVSTQTEEAMQIELMKDTVVSLKDDEIMDLKSKLNAIQIEQAKNVSDLVICKDEIELKNKEITALLSKLGKFEKDNGNYEQEIETSNTQILELENKVKKLETTNRELDQNKEEIRLKNDEIRELKNEINNLKKTNYENRDDIETRDKEILEFKNKIKDLEQNNNNNKEEIKIKNYEIIELKNEINNLKKTNSETTDKEILEFKNKIKDLEQNNNNNKEEIKIKNYEIIELKNEINNLKKTNSETRDKEILEFKNKIKDLEQNNNNNKEEIKIKNYEIIELKNEINNLKKTNSETTDKEILEFKNKVKDLEQNNNNNKEEIKIKNYEIIELKNEINNLKKTNSETRDKEILEFKNKIKDLEQNNNNNKEEIKIKNYEIIELKNEINNLKKTNSETRDKEILEFKNKIKDLEQNNNNNKEELKIKNDEIIQLKNEINHLKKICNENEEYIEIKDNAILELQNKIKYFEKYRKDTKECIQTRDIKILKLTDNIKELQTSNEQNKVHMWIKDKKIVELTNKLMGLEKEKNDEILEIASKISHYENEIQSKEKTIQELNDEITTLNNIKIVDFTKQLKDLEKEKNDEILEMTCKISHYKNEIQSKEKTIQELNDEITTLNNIKIVDFTKQLKDLEKEKNDEILEMTCKISHYKNEIQSKEKTIQELNDEITTLNNIKIVDFTKQLKDLEKEKNDEILEMTCKISHYKNEIQSKEKTIQELNDKITTLNNTTKSKSCSMTEIAGNTCRLSSSFTLDLSPKELRKIKRQSIHDQRRGIELAEIAAACNEYEELATNDEDLKETVKKLKAKLEKLTEENAFLESEVQGFMEVVDDANIYKKERDKEIEVLTEQIEKMRKGQALENCKECQQKQEYVKKLEKLQLENQFKIVGLQTKMFDLQNALSEEKSNAKETERRLRYDIIQLEKRLGGIPALKQTEDAEVQSEPTDLDRLLQKYSGMKKLARMRRNEANILRAKLGMQADEPIT